MKASIVIPVFNGSTLTEKCLRAILAHPPESSFEIIVVDDASTDDTPAVLRTFGGALRAIRSEVNGGFASVCNRGAVAAQGDYLVFLNNDTEPTPGWLDALVRYADSHPQVAVVGSQLRFPNDTIQHAGVVFCQDGRPRHLYAGLPASLPAVQRSRSFQAVTAACCLVRRDVFLEAGGFDEAYRNGMEDVDLCLRLGARGYGVHYCHESVVYHLESASRGRSSPEIKAGARRYEERWAQTVRRDDLTYYLEDRMLEIGYADGYPIQMTVSPLLAALSLEGRAGELERELVARARQVLDLLRDVTALSARIAGAAVAGPTSPPARGVFDEPRRGPTEGDAAFDPVALSGQLADIEEAICGVQRQLAPQEAGVSGTESDASPFPTTSYLGWRHLVRRVREVVEEHVPEGATVAVVSRGEEDLVRIPGRTGWHFPRSEVGAYAGHYPKDGNAAREHLEDLRSMGAEYLVFPATALWWLDHYSDFGRHLRESYEAVAWDPELCLILSLASPVAASAVRASTREGRDVSEVESGR